MHPISQQVQGIATLCRSQDPIVLAAVRWVIAAIPTLDYLRVDLLILERCGR